jgi:hypothetical protein
MPGPASIPRGNVSLIMVLNVTLSPAQVTNGTSAEQTFTVPGLLVEDVVTVNKPTTQAGLVIGGARVSANNTLAINFGNITGSPITPTASESYSVSVCRYENAPLQAAAPSGFA